MMKLEDFWKSRKKLVINLKMLEEYRVFCWKSHEIGHTWRYGKSYLTCNYWGDYRENTCCTNDGFYCSLGFAKKKKYPILQFTDIEWD